jgi:hypothetical protein
MTFRRAIPKCTADQQKRQDACRSRGCLACSIEGHQGYCGNVEIHHLTVSGRTIDQDHTIALGCWHHRGVISFPGMTSTAMRATYGPSLAKGSKTFHTRYGDNAELLAAQNKRIGE